MSDLKFNYGDLVRSKSPSTHGVVVGYKDSIYNERQWIINVPMIGKDVTIENETAEYAIDESGLCMVGRHAGERLESLEFNNTFEDMLGKKVMHIPTKVTGILTDIITHGNNAILACVKTNCRQKLNGKLVELHCYMQCITLVDEPKDTIPVNPILAETSLLKKEDYVHTIMGVCGKIIGYSIDVAGNLKYSLEITKTSEHASIENDSDVWTIFPWSITKVIPKEDSKEFDTEFSFELGQKVKHNVTETDGFVINKTMHLNDCRYYTVVFEDLNPVTGEFMTESIPEALLTLVIEEPPVVEQKTTPPVKRGGPNEKVPKHWNNL